MYSKKTTEEGIFSDGALQICENCGAAIAFQTLSVNGGVCPYCSGLIR